MARSSNRARAVEQVKPGWNDNIVVQILLALLRWLPEIMFAVAVVTVFVWLLRQDLPPWAAACVLVAPVSLLLAVPQSRRIVMAVLWSNVARHRIRSFFAETGIRNRSFRLPIILIVYPTRVGEKAWVALPAGFSVDDVTHNGKGSSQLASACYAHEARITAHKKHSNLVNLEIIRYQPFGATPIRNPLIKKGEQAVIPPHVPGSGSMSRDDNSTSSIGIAIPQQEATETKHRGLSKKSEPGKKSTEKKDTTKQSASAVTSANGEDISDYV